MGKGKATIRDVNGQIVEGEIISAQVTLIGHHDR